MTFFHSSHSLSRYSGVISSLKETSTPPTRLCCVYPVRSRHLAETYCIVQSRLNPQRYAIPGRWDNRVSLLRSLAMSFFSISFFSVMSSNSAIWLNRYRSDGSSAATSKRTHTTEPSGRMKRFSIW